MQKLRNTIAMAALAVAVPPLLAACSTTQPVSSSTNDAGTTARVKSRLLAAPQVTATNIDVDTETGVVYLHGKVKTEDERYAAERIAASTKGVRQVVNQIALESELPDDGKSDMWITTKVKSALAADFEVRAMNVDVDTDDGVVFLTGIVKEEKDRDKVIALAEGIDGVERVVDNMVTENEAWEMPREAPEFPGPEVEAQGPPAETEPTEQGEEPEQGEPTEPTRIRGGG